MKITPDSLPKVSILLAARNEKVFILDVLHSLASLDYPTEKLEIWIGDDHSTDGMEQVILPFIEDKPAFFYVRIDERVPSPLQGKARILEFLAQKATGDYFFFTDADMQLPNQWVKGMLAAFKKSEIGVVVGMSVVKNTSLFSALQGLEWLSVLMFSSCSMISRACSTQFSQMWPSWPAMRIFTSSRLLPQKEQCKVFFAICAITCFLQR